MLNQRTNFRVDDFVIAAAARGLLGQIDATMFVAFIEAIDCVFGKVEGQAQGLVVEPTHLGEVFFINVVLGRDWLKDELDERGSFLAGLIVGRGALNPAKIGAGGNGLRPIDFRGSLIQN